MTKNMLLSLFLALLVPSLLVFAVPDADQDGVPDSEDNCPNTQTTIVDQFGCSCAQKSCPSDGNGCTDDCGVVERFATCGFFDNKKPCEGGVCSEGRCGGGYTVSGIVFVDANANGVFDGSDQRMPGRTVILQDGSSPPNIIRTYTTGALGEYIFTLPEGRYRVTHIVPIGWSRTTDDSNRFELYEDFIQNFGLMERQEECGDTYCTGYEGCDASSSSYCPQDCQCQQVSDCDKRGCPNKQANLFFSTYLGGSQFEQARDVATDIQGNIYVTGGTESGNFPTTDGAYNRLHNTGKPESESISKLDVFVAKFDSNGKLIWSTLIGGPNYDRAYAIEIDSQGYILLAGRAGDGFPVTYGAFQTSFRGGQEADFYGNQDGFIAKLTPDGSNLVWASYFGTSDTNPVRDLAVDGRGNIYIASGYISGDFPDSVQNAFTNQPKGGADAVAAKIKSDGSEVLWATYLGGSGWDSHQNSVRVDGDGNPYLLFTTKSIGIATSSAYDTSFGGGSDVFVTKLSSDSGVVQWGTYIGGSQNELTETHELAVDSSGIAYIAVPTQSRDFQTSGNAFQQNYGGGEYDILVAKISSDGSQLLAGTYIGGSGTDTAEGISVDSEGNAYIAGTTFSGDFPVSQNAFEKSFSGSRDALAIKLTADLQLTYSTYFGGSGFDEGRSSTTDSNGNIIFTGQTESDDFPTNNAYDSSYNGNRDAFVAKVGEKDGDVIPPPQTALSISGIVFADANANGVFDGSDQRMPGRTVILQDGSSPPNIIRTYTTGDAGDYFFSGLSSGVYRVTHYVPTGYIRTTDDSDRDYINNDKVLNFGIMRKLETCSQKEGYICTASEVCPGTGLVASDTERCCSSDCVNPQWNLCSQCGNGFWNVCDKSECNSISQGCYFVDKLLGGDCSSCSRSACGNYTVQSTCIEDHCGFGNCNWDGNGCVSVQIPKTCSEQGGEICTSSETCPGMTLTSSDAGLCCDKACEAAPSFITVSGNYVELYNFPTGFFDDTSIPPHDVVKLLDQAYLLEGILNNGFYPTPSGQVTTLNSLQFAYDSNVYGANGFPLKLGSAAAPAKNNGDHSWDVMFHEMAHNFWNSNQFFSTIAVPGPFLQESTAVITAEFIYQKIKSNPEDYGITADELDSLARVFTAERDFQRSRYNEYINNGKPYSQDESGPNNAILTSQAFNYEMFLIGDEFGWDNFVMFNAAFAKIDQNRIAFWEDGVSDIEETTYAIAALSNAFGQDFRQRFRDLNFPINDQFYNEIFPILNNVLDPLPSCSQQGGDICSASESCQGNQLTHPNPGICCNQACVSTVPPTINSFAANPSAISYGESSKLSWSVTGADMLSIGRNLDWPITNLRLHEATIVSAQSKTDPEIGDVTGLTEVIVNPSSTTAYTMTAANSVGSDSQKTIVTVQSKLSCTEQGGNVCTTNQICTGTELTAHDAPLCCSVECTNPTCAAQNGDICTTAEVCPGSALTAPDTNRCCSQECAIPQWNSCSQCGGGLFNICDQAECNSITKLCYFDITGINSCKACAGASCENYDNQAICQGDHCGFGNCNWDGGSCSTIFQPPKINSFAANPTRVSPGAASTLSWSVTGTSSLSIDQGVGDVTGLTQKVVNPSSTATYTLTASNSEGSSIKPVTISTAQAPPHIKYFGYFGSNYIGGCAQCTLEMKDHVNVITVYAQLTNLPALAAEFELAAQHGVGVIVNVAQFFYPWPQNVFKPDFQQDWNQMAAFLENYQSQIVAFYHKDEPYYSIYGIGSLVDARKNELETVNSAIKAFFPNIPISVTFGPWIDENFVVPQGFDWVGYDCYVYVTDSLWGNCDGRGHSPAYFVDLLKRKKNNNQKIFLVPDGQYFRDYDQTPQGNIPISFTPELEQRKVDYANRYYDIARSEPEIIMMLPYLWGSYMANGYLYRGTRDMNLLKTRYNQIGREISGK